MLIHPRKLGPVVFSHMCPAVEPSMVRGGSGRACWLLAVADASPCWPSTTTAGLCSLRSFLSKDIGAGCRGLQPSIPSQGPVPDVACSRAQKRLLLPFVLKAPHHVILTVPDLAWHRSTHSSQPLPLPLTRAAVWPPLERRVRDQFGPAGLEQHLTSRMYVPTRVTWLEERVPHRHA